MAGLSGGRQAGGLKPSVRSATSSAPRGSCMRIVRINAYRAAPAAPKCVFYVSMFRRLLQPGAILNLYGVHWNLFVCFVLWIWTF
jgi:hypothetical protein